ncbi:MAG: hypothetical protein AW12_00319 [Candidatus Accumulibacter sp. BA-94]|nr:MAG: hypothetical protein AW12_00319 [Candidatus Accumulibacter sp. BA-94]
MGRLPLREPHRRPACHPTLPARHGRAAERRADAGAGAERGAQQRDVAVRARDGGLGGATRVHLRDRRRLQRPHRYRRHQRCLAHRLYRFSGEPQLHAVGCGHQGARYRGRRRGHLRRRRAADGSGSTRRLHDPDMWSLHPVGAERADRDADHLCRPLCRRRPAGARGDPGDLHRDPQLVDRRQLPAAGRLPAGESDPQHEWSHPL